MDRRTASHRWWTLAVVAGLATAPAGPAVAADRARELLLESEARHRTKTEEYAGDLEVVSKDGKVRKKGWRSFREGYAGDARSLVRFLDPPEVRGVGFLSLAKPGKNPDQWLYLPSMKRERRIAAQDRDASFVGTDFNYEDMEDFDQAKFDVELVREEELDGVATYVVEARPRDRSVYARRLLWVRKDILYLVRVDFFRAGEDQPAKRLLLSKIEKVDGHDVARRMEMRDLKKGSRTTVELRDLAFDRDQPAGRYTLQNLTSEDDD